LKHGIPVARGRNDNFVAPVALAPEFGFAVTYDGREAIKIWRLPPSIAPVDVSAEDVMTARVNAPHMTMDNSAAISDDGRQLAIATSTGEVRILPTDQRALLLPDSAQVQYQFLEYHTQVS
jgi:hypothetical protein